MKLDVSNKSVFDAEAKTLYVLKRHDNILVSISGGSDSDIVIDLIERNKKNKNVTYVFFDTGIEYSATKRHLDYLESRYNIQIIRKKTQKSIPTCVREFGIPFVSKYASDMISRLQKHGFKFEDMTYEELVEKYPDCTSALKWWCNVGNMKLYNINNNKWLKEFLISSPPQFEISNACCQYTKKKIAAQCILEFNADLSVTGVRKYEGGVRSTAYKSCYTEYDDGCDYFRPIFFFSNLDKEYYDEYYGIIHSDCYSEYGLKRTGCVGCPYGKNVLEELNVIQKYEPKMYALCMNVFGKSYEYTNQYRQFAEEMNRLERLAYFYEQEGEF